MLVAGETPIVDTNNILDVACISSNLAMFQFLFNHPKAINLLDYIRFIHNRRLHFEMSLQCIERD